jgi:putative glutamine amidotransferase
MMKIRSIMLILLVTIRLQGQDTLLLFHPTSDNLAILENLVGKEMIDLEGYHVLGVYHVDEVYDFIRSSEWLLSHPDFPGSLREVKGALEPGVLFGINACSSTFRELFSISRGALFMGGPDLPPVTFHEPAHLLTKVTDPFRHLMELSYLFHLLGGARDPSWIPWLEDQPEYLVSGICLGMQTINVATGGSLIQDIPTEIYGLWTAEEILNLPPDQVHRNYHDRLNTGCSDPTSYHFHRIRLVKDSFLSRESNYRSTPGPLVLSSHHQAVESLGSRLQSVATSLDGKIIEAIRHEVYPHVIGVQFHPEKPGLFDPAIVYDQHCNSRISFHKIAESSGSFNFHLDYWNYIGWVLQKAATPPQ